MFQNVSTWITEFSIEDETERGLFKIGVCDIFPDDVPTIARIT